MDITIESGIRFMGLAALHSIQIRDVEINPVHCFITVPASDCHICMMTLRLSLMAISPHVARFLASIADSLEKSAATPASTSTATTSATTSVVVDCLRTIAAAVVHCLGTTTVAAKPIMLLKTLEEKLLLRG